MGVGVTSGVVKAFVNAAFNSDGVRRQHELALRALIERYCVATFTAAQLWVLQSSGESKTKKCRRAEVARF
jgi:hypothetical protein